MSSRGDYNFGAVSLRIDWLGDVRPKITMTIRNCVHAEQQLSWEQAAEMHRLLGSALELKGKETT